MLLAEDRSSRREIFQAVRHLVQELHPDKAILEDVHGAPFLFKSQDVQVWVRVFYRAMCDFSVDELKQEIQKLWVLMPQDAVLYLFYPTLDREQILRMNGISDRLSFFEYGNLNGLDGEGAEIGICKWIPSMSVLTPRITNTRPAVRPPAFSDGFLERGRLTAEEIAELTEFSCLLRRS
ncbi:MAG TPA: hypothetical protein PLL75_01840 [Candidatus Omnitrophota bacterium]|nr:hypothetical protein [Candidatus Omnitrophota bacterium]HPS36455.1 hypothetical protein [Candidatus Omnitrophota bacterium]